MSQCLSAIHKIVCFLQFYHISFVQYVICFSYFYISLYNIKMYLFIVYLFLSTVGPPGVLGIWGEWLFIFRELGSTGNYFRGAREQAHNFGDIGGLAKKAQKINKEKPAFCLIF